MFVLMRFADDFFPSSFPFLRYLFFVADASLMGFTHLVRLKPFFLPWIDVFSYLGLEAYIEMLLF